MPKMVFLHHCYLTLRSGSKVGVKYKSQGTIGLALTPMVDIWRGSAKCLQQTARSYFWQPLVNVVGQRSRSNAKNGVFTSLLPYFEVRVKGRGQGQKSGSMSWVEVKGQVQISGRERSILVAKSNYSHYLSKVLVCVYNQGAYIVWRARLTLPQAMVN